MTKVDECGIPLDPGTPCGYVVTKGFVSVSWSPEIFEGDEIETALADGTLCVSDPACPEIKWINVEAAFCLVDPDLISFMTGYPIVTDAAGNSVGFRITGSVECDSGFALEVWSAIPQQTCGAGEQEFGYWLAPFMKQGILGDVTVENDTATFTVTARTFIGSGWGVGPWDVDRDAGGDPGPLLTPIGPDDHLDIHLTDVAPPDEECGCQPMPEESPSPGESPSP